MDCDGPKHALIRDLDGSFVGTYPVEGSVVPFAEIRYASPSHDVSQCTLGSDNTYHHCIYMYVFFIRFNNYINRFPVTWLAYEGNVQSLATPQQVVQYKGVARGNAR